MPDAGGAISNTSRESLYEFIDRETKIDESIEEAQYTVRSLKKTKKDLRALIVAAGFTLAVFDETRAKMAMAYEERESQDRELRRNMAWMGMPLGTQSEMFTDAETAVPPEIQLSRVRDAGRTAGKLGRERSANPWGGGSLLYSEWDSAWLAGREEAAQSAIDAPASAPKRGRGRPPKNATPVAPVFAQEPEPEVEAQPEVLPPPAGANIDFDSEVNGSA